jgi:hypothetical protein
MSKNIDLDLSYSVCMYSTTRAKPISGPLCLVTVVSNKVYTENRAPDMSCSASGAGRQDVLGLLGVGAAVVDIRV